VDKHQIISQVVNAIITVVTTTAVIRLSLNRGTFGITSAFKTRLRARLARYSLISFDVFMFLLISFQLYLDVRSPEPLSRLAVLYIVIWTLSAAFWLGKIISDIRDLTTRP
jgi:hypothetical protein